MDTETDKFIEKIKLWIGRWMYTYGHTLRLPFVDTFLTLTQQTRGIYAFVFKLNHFQRQWKEN